MSDVGHTFHKILVSINYTATHLRKLFVILTSCVLASCIDNEVKYCFTVYVRKQLMEQAKTQVNGHLLAQHILN